MVTHCSPLTTLPVLSGFTSTETPWTLMLGVFMEMSVCRHALLNHCSSLIKLNLHSLSPPGRFGLKLPPWNHGLAFLVTSPNGKLSEGSPSPYYTNNTLQRRCHGLCFRSPDEGTGDKDQTFVFIIPRRGSWGDQERPFFPHKTAFEQMLE